MELNNTQLSTLKTAILVDPILAALPRNPDSYAVIKKAFNVLDATFTVWKTNVSIGEVGDNIVATGLAALAAADTARLQAIADYSPNGINPSLDDRRAFFNDIFSAVAGASTRAKLLILWKRLATRAEKLYANTANGNGANATPALLVVEGEIDETNVLDAFNRP